MTAPFLISAGPITIDPASREAWVDGDLFLLSDGEFDVLRELAREPHERVPHERVPHVDLLDRVGHERSLIWLDFRVLRLRQKLRRVGVVALPASRGGYRLFEHVNEESAHAA